MKNLKSATKREEKKRLNEFTKGLKEYKTIEEVLKPWYVRDLIPASSKNKKWASVNELKAYLIARKTKDTNKRIDQLSSRIDTIKASQDVASVVINVEWNKSRNYGNQAKAEAVVTYKNGLHKRFEGSRTGGCGYDKESTAIADALNQCNGLLKMLYKVKNRNVKESSRELIGYGSGYGILPSFEGGVGVSCMYKICESLKMKFNSVSSGKRFDVYQITKK